jgi:hypothetical protein
MTRIRSVSRAAPPLRAAPAGLAAAARPRQSEAMRTVSDNATVRLYFLDDSDAVAETLFYGPLAEALALAREQPDAVQAGLWLATDNDVVAFLDLDP